MKKGTSLKTRNFDLDALSRKVVRYHCFRVRNQEGGGAKADAPKGFRRHVESLEEFMAFGGWAGFGVKWDWTGRPSGMSAVEAEAWAKFSVEDAPLSIIPLQVSLMMQWEKICLESAKVVPAELLAKIERHKQDELDATRQPVEDIILDAVVPKGGGDAKVTKRKHGNSDV